MILPLDTYARISTHTHSEWISLNTNSSTKERFTFYPKSDARDALKVYEEQVVFFYCLFCMFFCIDARFEMVDELFVSERISMDIWKSKNKKCLRCIIFALFMQMKAIKHSGWLFMISISGSVWCFFPFFYSSFPSLPVFVWLMVATKKV